MKEGCLRLLERPVTEKPRRSVMALIEYWRRQRAPKTETRKSRLFRLPSLSLSISCADILSYSRRGARKAKVQS